MAHFFLKEWLCNRISFTDIFLLSLGINASSHQLMVVELTTTSKNGYYIWVGVSFRKVSKHVLNFDHFIKLRIFVIFIEHNVLASIFENAMTSKEADNEVIDFWSAVISSLKHRPDLIKHTHCFTVSWIVIKSVHLFWWFDSVLF